MLQPRIGYLGGIILVSLIAAAETEPFLQDQQDETEQLSQTQEQETQGPRTISSITVHGNKYVTTDAILSYVPYRVGEVFSPNKTRELICNLYYELRRFKHISVYGENRGDSFIDLHIDIIEKTPLRGVVFTGNRAISEADIRKKVNFDFDKVPAVDEEELKKFAFGIKKLYTDKGYNNTVIESCLETDEKGTGLARFIITENARSTIRKICFSGNAHVSSKELKKAIYSREDWVLGFIDQSGIYHPDKIEADKHMIEQYYHNRGYITAKVTDARCAVDSGGSNMSVTFDIYEGPVYTVSSVDVTGNEVLSADFLRLYIPIQPGHLYSQDAVMGTIKILESVWGNYGYIFAHINPSIEVNDNDHTVVLKFFCDSGKPITLNRIVIKGNKKTRDKVIRRRIALDEGELVTKVLMERSKANVESLGFFDQRDGVNWKTVRLDDGTADLILAVKEASTGHFSIQAGFGASGVDLRSPSEGFNVKVLGYNTNLFGQGININCEASWAHNEQTAQFHIAQPWLFDKPISGAVDIYHRRPTYEELRLITPPTVNEKVTGGAGTLGFIVRAPHSYFNEVQILGSFGADGLRYERLPLAYIPQNIHAQEQYQRLLSRSFVNGTFLWFGQIFEQDYRNHPMHTTRGHKWKVTSKVAFPIDKGSLGFYKFSADYHFFTPLINEFDLVFHLRGFVGLIASLGNNNIPFGELFHIGGLGSVRGFTYGQIGPKFQGDTIGAQRALFVNAELIFPITPDLSMKGVLFYDGGAGFHTPNANLVSPVYITGNHFDYRHGVGIGLHLLQPMPVRIYWGFKLDPRIDRDNPSRSEQGSEVHFTMSYDF